MLNKGKLYKYRLYIQGYKDHVCILKRYIKYIVYDLVNSVLGIHLIISFFHQAKKSIFFADKV